MKALDRNDIAFLLLGCVLVAVFAFPIHVEYHAVVINTFEAFASGLATVVLFAVARRFGDDEPMRYWWGMLGAGMLCNSIGFGIYGVLGYPSTEAEIFPTEADPWWVLTYPFLIFGTLKIRREYLDSGLGLARSQRVLWLAALVMSVVVGYFVWPTIQNPAESWYETFILVSYPLGDAIVLAVTLSILSIIRQFGAARVAWPWWGLIAGWLCVASADLTYTYMSDQGTYVTGTLPDLLWMLQGWFIAWGAYRQFKLLEPMTAPA